MKYSSYIDNITATKWGLNVQQAVLFDWLYSLSSWAESLSIPNKGTFYFASRHKAITELPLLTTKPDTIYRYYKQLESLGLIEVVKFDGKDCIRLLPVCKQWGRTSEDSEINPNKLGNKSENNSEIFPTYKYTSINKNTINKQDAFSFRKELSLLGIKKDLIDDWLKVRKKKKAVDTKRSFQAFLNQVEKSGKPLNEIIELCVEKSWKGFESSWINQNQPENNFPISKTTPDYEKIKDGL